MSKRVISPQTENGFVRIAGGDKDNDVLMALIEAGLTGPQYQIVLTVIRKTWGYNKKEDWISLTQFQKITGLTRANVCKNITKLVSAKILAKKSYTGIKTIYRINKNFAKWTQLVSAATTSIGSDNPLVSPAIHTKDNIQKTIRERAKIFVERFNELSGLKCRPTEGKERLLKSRLKSFSFEEIVKATELMLSNDFFKGRSQSKWFATPEWILESDAKIDRFLNTPAEPTKQEKQIEIASKFAKEIGLPIN
jgi:phage replication O-like protein O